MCNIMVCLGSYIEIPHKISKESDKLGSTLLKWTHTLRRGESTEYVLYMVVIPRPYMYY